MKRSGIVIAVSVGAAGIMAAATAARILLINRISARKREESCIAILKSGYEANRLIKALANEGEKCTNDDDCQIQAIVRSYSCPTLGTKTKELQDSGPSVVAWFEKHSGRIRYYTKADIIRVNNPT